MMRTALLFTHTAARLHNLANLRTHTNPPTNLQAGAASDRPPSGAVCGRPQPAGQGQLWSSGGGLGEARWARHAAWGWMCRALWQPFGEPVSSCRAAFSLGGPFLAWSPSQSRAALASAARPGGAAAAPGQGRPVRPQGAGLVARRAAGRRCGVRAAGRRAQPCLQAAGPPLCAAHRGPAARDVCQACLLSHPGRLLERALHTR
jgi:hypothetical protein